jgi:REP element-mobilizing transposase RayT
MARKPRIDIPGSCYHVILRGNLGQNIFFSKEDQEHFYNLLQIGVERYQHRIHAFCCMSNHVHILIQTQIVSLAKIVHNLSFRYTQWINQRMNRKGHLFQGRYKAILIDMDRYLLQLVRYIHLNPVRANLTKRPEDYIWSSHLAYLGNQKIPWLTTDWVLSQFAKDISSARVRYQSFVYAGINEKQHNEFLLGIHDNRLLGDDVFIQNTLKEAKQKLNHKIQIADVIEVVCNALNLNLKDLMKQGKHQNFAKARGILALLVSDIPSITLTELGKILNRDMTTLSAHALRIKKISQSNQDLARQINQLRNLILNLKIAKSRA